jgi:YVTN family beta-propeller protein
LNAGVFISYRRGPTSSDAGRLYDRLSDRFGASQVFMDVDTIEPGVDFIERIEGFVSGCAAMVIVIGPDWIVSTDREGRRRLDHPDDLVRREVQAGLERGVRAIPVLVNGAVMPTAGELPEPIAPLARRNAIELRHVRWHDDVRQLEEALDDCLGTPEAEPAAEPRHTRRTTLRSGRFRLMALAAAAIAVAVVAALVALSGGGEEAAERPGPERLATGTTRVGSEPTGAAVGGGAVWVVNAGDGTVTRIDPASRSATGRPIEVEEGATFIDADDTAVWVTSPGDPASGGTVTKIDAATATRAGRPVNTGTFPAGVAVGDGAAWVGNAGDGTVARVDARSMAMKTIPVETNPLKIAWGFDRVWVPAQGDNSLAVIDARTEAVEKTIFVGRNPSGVATGAGAVWVSNRADDTVWRIDPGSGKRVGRPIEVGRNPIDVAVGEGSVWVANESDGTVTRIDPETNRVVGRPIPVGRSPSGLAVGFGTVWVPNEDDDTVTWIKVR